MTRTLSEIRRLIIADFHDDLPIEEEMDKHNDLVRELIAGVKAEHGEAWLGHVNLYEHNRQGPIMWQWDNSLVFNFGASFVAPHFDQELVYLIRGRDMVPYTGTKQDYELIEPIFERIAAIGGIPLNWR